MISGICAGIAEFYGWDPGAVRAVFALLAVFGGSGFIAYLILYFLMPAPHGTEHGHSGSPC